MTEDEIDYSDIPPLTDDFFSRASLRIPIANIPQWVEIEVDILEWFQAQSKEHKTLINTALREYVNQHQQQSVA